MTEPHEVHERLRKPRTKAIFQRWLEDHPIDSLPFSVDPRFTEIGFQVSLTDDIVYCGRIDALARMRNTQQWVVVDFKTTRTISAAWLKKWWMDTQISGYTYAAQEHTGMPVIGMILGVIELPEPMTATRKCKDHGVPYTECDLLHAKFQWIGPIWRTQEQLAAWRMTMIGIAKKYQGLHTHAKLEKLNDRDPLHALNIVPMEGTFTALQYTNACTFCSLHQFCKDGRPGHLKDDYLVHQPWWTMPEMLEEKAPSTNMELQQ